MKDVTQPLKGRGTMLSVVATVAALVGLLAFAPLASAASDPLSSGTTTLTLNKGFFKKLKKSGVKVLKLSPGTVKSRTVTLPVSGGSLDPTTGLGTIEQNPKSGLKFKHGKKTAPVNTLVLETSTNSLKAKVAGKNMKLASVAGVTVARNGFGANVSVTKLKLTGKAAKQLNKKLGFTGKKKSGKKNKRASASKTAQPPFKGGQVLGGSKSETQPKTVTVLPGGNVTFATNASTVAKLSDVEVEIEKQGATTELSSEPPPIYGFPISGGSISPAATGGTVLTSGGLKLVQVLPTGPESALKTVITLGEFSFDLAAKTVLVEVIAESNASEKLNLGKLGRSSIADISLTGAAVTSDPTTHTVSVQNAAATLQPISAEVLNGFSQVYQGYLTAVFQGPPFFLTKEEAEAAAAEAVKEDHLAVGDPLGTISFTAHTQ
jgi:hypothetical protein